MKKYNLTDEIISHNGIILRRIECICSFSDVIEGEKGGWIEKEENLSQEGDCWIYDNAKVWRHAEVYGNAVVYGNAKIYGNDKVSGDVAIHGSAEIHGDTRVFGHAEVWEYAKIYGNAIVYGNTEIYGNAIILGESCVFGGARLSCGVIESTYDYITIGPIGSRKDILTYNIRERVVIAGCFEASLEEFIKKVSIVHRDNIHGIEYEAVINLFKSLRRDYPFNN